MKPVPSSRVFRLWSTSEPAGSCASAVIKAGWSSPRDIPKLRSRSASGSMRSMRRAPPTTFTCAVLGTVLNSRASTSPKARSCPGVWFSPCSVSVRKGTSSMVSSFTTGFMAPVGSTSLLDISSW